MSREGLLVVLMLSAAAVVRGIYLAAPSLDSDEAVVGLMAIHILKGEFPVFYWGEPYCGPVESYLASLLFFLFGSSRLTLNVAPAIVSLFFLLAAWRFARMAFGRQVGLVSLLFLAVGPAFLVWHSVLARGNYIENLFFGTVLMGLVLKTAGATSDAARWRGLFLLAFVSGVAWWVSFQSVHFLLACGVVLLVGLGRFLLDRRLAVAFLMLLLGSLLFWIYNLQHDFASLAETARYMGRDPLDLSLKLFFLRKLPSILAMPMTEMARAYSSGVNFTIMAIYLGALAVAVWTFVRRMARRDLRRSPETTGLALLVLFTAIAAAIIISRYNTGGVVRYFLVFYVSLPIILAYTLTRLFSGWPATVLVAWGLVLLVNLTGSVSVADSVNPLARQAYWEGRDRERDLIRALRERGIRAVAASEYWEFFRTNFEAVEDPVFAMPLKVPIENKFWPYTDYALSQEQAPFLWHGGVENFRASLRAIGAGFSEERVGPYTLFSGFRPAVSSFEEISPAGWRVEVPAGADQARFMLDRDPATHWGSGVPQEAGWTIRVDLGRSENVAKVVLEPGPVPGDVPAEFEIRTSRDGREWETAVPAHSFAVPLAWMGSKVVVDDRDVVRGIFSPRSARFVEIRLTRDKPFHWRVSMLRIYRAAVAEIGAKGASGSARTVPAAS
ncbi:MAG: discoidin domain-containing protein [Nitrospirae bacterium]|nr:discoidin domain-containing protein [Nitrospirota bacterium]